MRLPLQLVWLGCTLSILVATSLCHTNSHDVYATKYLKFSKQGGELRRTWQHRLHVQGKKEQGSSLPAFVAFVAYDLVDLCRVTLRGSSVHPEPLIGKNLLGRGCQGSVSLLRMSKSPSTGSPDENKKETAHLVLMPKPVRPAPTRAGFTVVMRRQQKSREKDGNVTVSPAAGAADRRQPDDYSVNYTQDKAANEVNHDETEIIALPGISALPNERLDKFRRAAIERNMAIRARQRERWARLDGEEGPFEEGYPQLAEEQTAEEAAEARAFNLTEEQNQWYSMISGASFRAANHSSDLFYESLVEKALVRMARWTKETPSIDRFFRPIDALLDALFASRTPSDNVEARNPARFLFGRQRRMYPLPVQQGLKYPLRMTAGPVRSRSGTVYLMNDKPGLGVNKKRKELRLSAVTSAWYGDPAYPWVETVAGGDGTWIRVGLDVTDKMRLRMRKGVLSVPLPFRDFLGDPCAGINKRLIINYTDKMGSNKTCEWDDGSSQAVDYIQAIRATYSLQRLANIVRGDISEVNDAIQDTRPLVTSLREYLTSWQERGGMSLGRTYELEARLGFVQGIDGMGEARARFENGVSREFMDRVLDICEEWDDWTSLGAWSEMHDFIFRVGATQMRTTVAYDKNSDDDKVQHTRRTVKKKILKVKDYSYISTLGGIPRTGMLSADVRVALSEEMEVNENDLAEWGKDRRPLRVRIKQRRSFHYTPEGADRPVWRFDFTLVWSAKSLKKAQLKQRFEEPSFELECELIDPWEYLQREKDDAVVAKGLLLKLRDFLEPWGGYKLEAVANKPFSHRQANRQKEK